MLLCLAGLHIYKSRRKIKLKNIDANLVIFHKIKTCHLQADIINLRKLKLKLNENIEVHHKITGKS